VALLVAGGAGRARAGLIVGNLDQPGYSSTDNPFAAQSFTVGGVSQTLGSVTLRLTNFGFADETVTVNLFSDNGGVPGSSLLTIGSVTVPVTPDGGSYTDFTLSAPSAFTLEANTPYWLEAEVPDGFNVNWANTNTTTTTGPGILGNGADAYPQPPNWSLFDLIRRLQLEVDGAPVAAVPEPSSLALLGLGSAGLLGWRVRRRAAA
jgi:hypothetical protein